MDKTRASIAILSDRALCRSGLAALLRSQGFERISEYATSRELISGSHSHSPDVLLVDLDHEHEDTMTVLHSLRREFCGAFIVVIGTPSQQGAADGSYDAQVQTPDGDISVLIAAARLNGPARRTSRESRRQHALWDHVTPRQRDVLTRRITNRLADGSARTVWPTEGSTSGP